MTKPSDLFVALIPDGGRRAVGGDIARYAESYEHGAEVVADILKLCVADSRVKIFAAWGLSDDNAQRRTSMEREILNQVFCAYLTKLRRDVDTPPYQGVQVVHMGNPTFLHPDVYEQINDLTEHTKGRTEKAFGLCLGYGSHDEMQRAVVRSRAYPIGIDWRQHLDLPLRGNMPYQHVDLIARTGTDPLKPYTSGYLLPYQGPKTQERYVQEFLPSFAPERFMAFIDEVSAQEKRCGA